MQISRFIRAFKIPHLWLLETARQSRQSSGKIIHKCCIFTDVKILRDNFHSRWSNAAFYKFVQEVECDSTFYTSFFSNLQHAFLMGEREWTNAQHRSATCTASLWRDKFEEIVLLLRDSCSPLRGSLVVLSCEKNQAKPVAPE